MVFYKVICLPEAADAESKIEIGVANGKMHLVTVVAMPVGGGRTMVSIVGSIVGPIMPMVVSFGIVVVIVVVMVVAGNTGSVMAVGLVVVTGMLVVALVVFRASAMMAFSAVTSAVGPCAGGKKHHNDDRACPYIEFR
jgi:hypothetical protein